MEAQNRSSMRTTVRFTESHSMIFVRMQSGLTAADILRVRCYHIGIPVDGISDVRWCICADTDHLDQVFGWSATSAAAYRFIRTILLVTIRNKPTNRKAIAQFRTFPFRQQITHINIHSHRVHTHKHTSNTIMLIMIIFRRACWIRCGIHCNAVCVNVWLRFRFVRFELSSPYREFQMRRAFSIGIVYGIVVLCVFVCVFGCPVRFFSRCVPLLLPSRCEHLRRLLFHM